MMQWGWGGGYGWGIVSMVLSFVFIAAIIVGVVLVVRVLLQGSTHTAVPPVTPPAPEVQAPPAAAAVRVLDERYARGEIDREEYLMRKQDLTS